jgi:hypothetical protein
LVGFLSSSFPIQFQPLGNFEQNILSLTLIFCSSTDGTEGGGGNDRSVPDTRSAVMLCTRYCGRANVARRLNTIN